MAPRGRFRNHCCSKCNKSFRSGNALGGHMSCHWRIDKRPKSVTSTPVVDLHASMLSSCDDKSLLLSQETRCQMCSKVFSTSKSLRQHMSMHGGNKVMAKPEEEAAELVEALAISDVMHNAMMFSSVKRKRSFRSKRQTPALNLEEIDAAGALLLLSERFDKTLGYEHCYLGDKEDNSLASIVLAEVNTNAMDRCLVQSVNSKEPKGDNNSACANYRGQGDKENSLVPYVPEEEMDLKDFDHERIGDIELWKPASNDNSIEEMKLGDLSAAKKAKNHRCNACGKSFRSGQALGGHMRCHYVPKCNRHQGFSDFPDSVVMKEQKLKLGLDLKLLHLRLPALTAGDNICLGVKPEPRSWCVTSNLH